MERPPLDVAALAAALALAATFGVAAVAKLRSAAATEADFASLGLPRPDLWVRLVPAMESATAAVLVVVPGWGGVLAFALLAAFTANLAAVLRSGRVASCACFGGATATPVSSRHLVRNGILLAVALLAATFDGTSWSGW